MTGQAPWPFFEADEIDAAVRVLRSGKVNYWTGEECRQLEREFAAACGVRYAVALANGSVAIELALKACGIGPGDEVVVTPRSFMASASSVVLVGARPVFADVDPASQNITAETVRAALTPRTRAVICVHLAGWPCDMDPLTELARERDLVLIEDCAQAHGARYKGRPVGSLGHVAFSFCQDKIMTTGGEGGMLLTDDPRVWEASWSYKDHGKSWQAVHEREHGPGFRWLHESFGTNWRLTEVQAAIGRVQLAKLGRWVEARRRNAAVLTAALADLEALRVTPPPPEVGHAYYKYYAFLRPGRLRPGWNRDRIMQEIADRGVPCFVGSCSEIYLERAFDGTGMRPAARPASPRPTAPPAAGRQAGSTAATSAAFTTCPGRPPRHPPAPRSSFPLPQPGVLPPDLHRAPRPRRGRGGAPDRAAGGLAAAGRLGHRRRGRIPPRRPACHAGQPGRPVALDVQDGAGTAPDAPGARGGRLGDAAWPPLRHGAGGPGTRSVVDLLPDRQAGTLAAWLRRHPGVEVVARDRAGAYADGARAGAPQARQVADRWHILRYLGDALRSAVERQHGAIRRIARQMADEMAARPNGSIVEALRPTAPERRKQAAFARRQARYKQAERLLADGLSLPEAAARMGVDPRTLRRWREIGHAPLWDRRPGGSILDPFRDYLERRWTEGCGNARQLWRELVERGFAGRPSIVRVWTGRRRKTDATLGMPSPAQAPRPRRWRPPSLHRLTRLLTADPGEGSGPDRLLCDRLLTQMPDLRAAASAARRLVGLLRKKDTGELATVLAEMAGTPLARFAEGLKRDATAVQNALKLPWTTSPVEGQVNRIKTFKRAMDGRAGFDLLRRRVLVAA